jgi:hypothetical protein
MANRAQIALNLNGVSGDYSDLLVEAAYNGDFEFIKALFPYVTEELAQTIAEEAARHGRRDVLTFILCSFPGVIQPYEILFQALLTSQKHVIEFLLNGFNITNPVDVDVIVTFADFNSGWVPLIQATTTLIKFLKNSGNYRDVAKVLMDFVLRVGNIRLAMVLALVNNFDHTDDFSVAARNRQFMRAVDEPTLEAIERQALAVKIPIHVIYLEDNVYCVRFWAGCSSVEMV